MAIVAVALAAALFVPACHHWEELGEGVAKKQATVWDEWSEEETALAHGVSTAVRSYEEERERQGQPACTSAALPLVVAAIGVVRTGCISFFWKT
jgi:hypothetical protein